MRHCIWPAVGREQSKAKWSVAIVYTASAVAATLAFTYSLQSTWYAWPDISGDLPPVTVQCARNKICELPPPCLFCCALEVLPTSRGIFVCDSWAGFLPRPVAFATYRATFLRESDISVCVSMAEERPPTPPSGSPGSAKDAAASASSPQGEVQELFSMDMWGAVLIAVMMLLGLMQGVTASCLPGSDGFSLFAECLSKHLMAAEHMAPRCEC